MEKLPDGNDFINNEVEVLDSSDGDEQFKEAITIQDSVENEEKGDTEVEESESKIRRSTRVKKYGFGTECRTICMQYASGC